MNSAVPSTAAVVAHLESRARAANTLAELAFSIANDTLPLLGFRQALVFAGSGRQVRLQAISGLVLPAEDSPYLLWVCRCWPWIQQKIGDEGGWLSQPVQQADATADSVPNEVLDGWQEWWPQGVLALPLRRRDGVILAWVAFLFEQPPAPLLRQALAHLSIQWSYAWEMLGGQPRLGLLQRWQGLGRKRHLLWAALAVLAVFPVRQSTLAPAEIIALDATSIAAPMDGVVKTFHVQPNQLVKSGDLLLSLDSTTLLNRLEVATQSLAVADAEWIAASQKAFDSFQSKSELTLLQGRVQEKRAELAAVQVLLNHIDVRAPHDGIAVFGATDDWLGRPVVTGERIVQVANPASAGVLIYLPVSDALVLKEDAAVTVFLKTKPLSPLQARVTQTSYQATLSPDNIASYRLRAALESDQQRDDVRVGLHGTAKISGVRVPLMYYLFRRPLAALRAWSGW